MPKNQTYLTAIGTIRYQMTNDYMFRAILQKNQKVLRGLVSALLHMRVEEIMELSIVNPLSLEKLLMKKQLCLTSILNCRAFGPLEKGDDYTELLPATHIGFLDFTLFPEHPEFFATCKLLNTKNYHLYSDKFVLNVVDLNRTDLATEEDKAYQLDQWVRIFKATTWEELHMLAQNNEYVEEIMNTMYECHFDANICKQCSDREAELAFRKMEERYQKKLAEENAQLKALLKVHNIDL